MSFEQPLNLYYWLVQTVAGNLPTFIFLSFIVLAYAAIKFRMPNMVAVIMMALFVVFLGQSIAGGMVVVVILVTCFIVYYALSKPFKQ